MFFSSLLRILIARLTSELAVVIHYELLVARDINFLVRQISPRAS